MSSGQSQSNLTRKFEEERKHTQEQGQIVHLQGQIDELRRQIKEQTNKYQWAIEQVRKTEGAVSHVQTRIEHHANEVNQIIDRSRRDVLDVRKEVSSAVVKMQESYEPIRQMQAQIQQLAEAQKKDREQTVVWFERITENEQKIPPIISSLKEIEERYRKLEMQLTGLHEADAEAVKEARRVGELLQVEKHTLRRQAVEAHQLVMDIRNTLEEQEARITRIDEIRQYVDLFAEQLPKQISDVSTRFPEIESEIKRIERIATERFLMNQERLEELRRQVDEKVLDLQETEGQHTQQHITWLERLDSLILEFDQKLIHNIQGLEEVQHIHKFVLQGIEEREMQTISAIQAVYEQLVGKIKSSQADYRRQS